jgi:hypothetical protein
VILNNEQEELMVRYLLGEATDEERTHVEERFLSDHDYFQQMLALEDALVDQYVTGDMPVSQRVLFEKSSVSERREKVEFTKELIDDIRKKNSTVNAPAEPSLFTMIFFRRGIVPTMLAAAALLVLIAAPWVLTISLGGRVTRIQNELASKQREAEERQVRLKEEQSEREQVERDLNAVQESVRVNQTTALLFAKLSPDRGQRSGGGGALPVIEVGPLRQLLSLRLPLETPESYKSYRVTVSSSDNPIGITFFGLTLENDRSSLNVQVAAQVFKPGDYHATVFGEQDNREPVRLDNYSFRIKRAGSLH